MTHHLHDRACRVFGMLATLGCLLVAGCQQEPPPTAPPRTETQIGGQVTDALSRGLPGALVEVLDGPAAGKRIVADADGKFAATSIAAVGVSVTLRASKDGYRPTTIATTWVSLLTPASVLLRMPAVETYSVLEPGEYTVTVGFDLESARSRIAAAPCSGFPVELASRTFDARITGSPAGMRQVDIHATPVRAVRSASFHMFVAGDSVAFDVGDDGILEDFPGLRYLSVWAGVWPNDSRPLTLGAAISIPVSAEFRYCQLKSARGRYNDCSQVPGDLVLAYHSCTSDHATMTFTKR